MRNEYHQPVGLRIGQWLDHPRVDVAADRRVRADAEGQSDDGDNRESTALAELANPEFQIMPKGFKEPSPRSSQLKSLMYPRFPKCCSAVRRAASGVIPRRMFSKVRKSMWNCHSSAISRWTASPRRSARKRMASFGSHSMVPPSGGAQHLANC